MQSKMSTSGHRKPSGIAEEVIFISDSSDGEITIEPGEVEDDDEVDEDVLFLRLQALKSMPEALSDEEDDLPSKYLSPTSPLEDSLTSEMVDLLDEADSAAQNVPAIENLCDDETAPQEMTPKSNTPDNFLKPNLLEIRKKVKAKKDFGSPRRPIINDYLNKKKGMREGHTKSEKVPLARGMLRVSSFARLSESKEKYGSELTTVSSANPDNYEIVDMEVVNSAEDQFFRDQMDPVKQRESHFYWGMINNLPPPPPPPPVQMSDVLLLPSSEEQYEAFLTACASGGPRYRERARNKANSRKRRSSDSESRLVGSPMSRKLRRLLLSNQVKNDGFNHAKKAKDAESNAKFSQKMADDDDYINELRAKLLLSVEKAGKISPPTADVPSSKQPQPVPTSSKSAHPPLVKSSKRPNSALGNVSKKAISSLRDEDTRKKHFPNLYCTTIIPLSDSEDDEKVDNSGQQQKSTSLDIGNEFEAHLDSFLKSIRTKEDKKAVPPPKPTRKNPPGKQTNLKANVSSLPRVKSINLADQPELMLMNMSPEKQEEYKRLKALIEKKEKAKKLVLSSKAVTSEKLHVKTLESNKQNGSQKATRDEDEDENDLEAQLLREKLLSSMKKLNDNAQGSQKEPVRSPSSASGQVILKPTNHASSENILPLTKRKTLIIEVPKPQEPDIPSINEENCPQIPKCPSPVPAAASSATTNSQEKSMDDVQALRDSEKMLFLSRIAMIQRLDKLSEGARLLADETIKVQETEKFVEDLKKQLVQVEEILASRKKRVSQLQTTTKEAHNAIIPLRRRIQEAESLCLSNGAIVHGSTYCVPTRGIEKIDELWSGIRQNFGTLMIDEAKFTSSTGEKVKEQVKPVSVCLKSSNTICDQVVIEALSSSSQSLSLDEVVPRSQENEQDVNSIDQVVINSFNSPSFDGSALEHLKPQSGLKLNPFQDLCPFWLMGRCNNETCQYQHS